MNKPILSLLLASLFVTRAEAASYREWRQSIRTAHEASVKGDLQKARQILEATSEEAEQQGPDTFAENSIMLADILLRTNQPSEAREVIDAALVKMGSPSRKNSILWKGLLHASRAAADKELKNYESAAAHADGARRLIEAGAGMGQIHPEMANVHWLIGEIALARKDYTKAEDEFKKGLRIAELRPTKMPVEVGRELRAVGDYSSSGVLLNRSSLGNVCLLQNRPKEAEEHFNDALKFAEKEYGKNSEAMVVPLAGRATLHHHARRRGDFEADTQRIYEIAQNPKPINAKYINPIWLKFRLELDETNRPAAAETADKIASVFAAQNYGTRMLATDALKIAQSEKTIVRVSP